MGHWYRAIDKYGDTLDFMLSEQRDEAATTAFFKQAIDINGWPHKVVMDKSGANYAGIENINLLMLLAGWVGFFIEICQVKYLNNIIGQDHRYIKKITKPMMGFQGLPLSTSNAQRDRNRPYDPKKTVVGRRHSGL